MVSITTLIGSGVPRVDGRKKVTGQAQYAADVRLENTAHAVMVGSTVPSGRIVRLDVSQAERVPGVLLVLTHQNRGSLGKLPAEDANGLGQIPETRPALEDAEIHYYGQYVAMIVAETLEEARQAASLIEVECERAPFAVTMDDPRARETAYWPKSVLGEDLQITRGDPMRAMAEADVRIDAASVTMNEHPCAMEPHATVASWSGDALTVYDATQWVLGDVNVLRTVFGLRPENVRVISPFVGGMFGSKVATAGHTILAALAAKRLERPVKVVLSRQQVLTDVSHRTETVQRLEIGATREGRLTALRHHTRTHTARNEFLDDNEYREATSFPTRMLYACPNFEARHECVRLNVMKPGWMRAPGETPGVWALETALDELACALKIDPVELRRRNHADIDPQTKKPFSSKHLLECYDRAAARFDWERRNPEPRSMRDGETLIGWGMATATYPGMIMGAAVRVRLERLDSGVQALVSTAGSDVGTGMYTMMTVVAAEGLGLPVHRVTTELGDSSLPPCALAGGSNLTASTAPAVMDACKDIQRQLLVLAATAGPGFEKAEQRPDDFIFSDGRILVRSNPEKMVTYADLLSKSGKYTLNAEAKTEPKFLRDDHYVYQSFGAQFAEVRVDPDIGRIRVSRVVSVFDVGRVMNAKTARSQLIGGIVFGIGQALLEELVYDPAHGQPVNADLAGYLVPVCADVPDIDVSWVGEPDLQFNSMGCRGLGEIGITGIGAAISNAVYHATGVRVREVPITPEKIL